MKKVILFCAVIFSVTALSAQSKPAAAKSPSAQNAGACYTDKKWMLSKVEKFGQEKDPSDEMKKDFLILSGDGSFKLMYKGIDKFGTYTKGGILQLKLADGSATWPFKVLACEGNSLKVDYRDGDTHNILTYTAQ